MKEKEKIDYKKVTEEEIERKIKELKYQLMIAKVGGSKTAELEGKIDRGKLGSDIQKRIRREIAKLNTELTRRGR